MTEDKITDLKKQAAETGLDILKVLMAVSKSDLLYLNNTLTSSNLDMDLEGVIEISEKIFSTIIEPMRKLNKEIKEKYIQS